MIARQFNVLKSLLIYFIPQIIIIFLFHNEIMKYNFTAYMIIGGFTSIILIYKFRLKNIICDIFTKKNFNKNFPNCWFTILIIPLTPALLFYLKSYIGIPYAIPESIRHFKEFLYIILSTVLVSIMEEIFFRGIIFRSLKNLYSSNNAIFLSSLAFAVSHRFIDIKTFLFHFVFGIFFCRIYIRGEILIFPIIFHVLLNCVVSFLMYIA